MLLPGNAAVRNSPALVIHMCASSANSMSLQKYAGKIGYRNCLVPHLRALRKHYEIRRTPKPKKRSDMVAELIKEYEPDLSDEELRHRIDVAENMEENDGAACCAYDDNSLLEFLEVDEDDEALMEAGRLQEQMAARERSRAAAGRRVPAPTSQTVPMSEAARATIRDHGEWTQRQAKMLLPPLARISLHKVGGPELDFDIPFFRREPRSQQEFRAWRHYSIFGPCHVA